MLLSTILNNSLIGVEANNKELLDAAFKYCRKNNFDDFLKEVAPILSDGQKMCILLNLVNSSLSDGEAEKEEQEMFAKVMGAFGVSEERFRPFFEVIAIKHDKSIFTNPNHPYNQPNYQVKLPV